MSFGKKPKQPEIPTPTPLLDDTNAAIKREQMKALKSLLKRRGFGKTGLSGRLGDNEMPPLRKIEPTRALTPTRRSATIMTGAGV
jgi:hypothetical protein